MIFELWGIQIGFTEINTIIEPGIIAFGLSRMLTARFSPLKVYSLFIAVYVSSFFLELIFPYISSNPFKNIISLFLLLILIITLFTEPLTTKLLAFFLLFAGMFAIDIIISFPYAIIANFASKQQLVQRPDWNFILFTFDLLLLVYVLAIGEFFKIRVLKAPISYLYNIVAIPISQFIAICGVYGTVAIHPSKATYVIGIVAALLSTASILWLFRMIKSSSIAEQTKANNELLILQQKLQFEHYSALIRQIEKTEKIRHDIGNHLQTFQTLLDQNKCQQAQEAFSLVADSFNESKPSVYCENQIVNAVCHNKINLASENSISVNLSISIPANTSFNELDLMSIMLNLFDNAIEGCLNSDKSIAKKISLKDRIGAGFYILRMENTKSADSVIANNSPKTTKKDSEVHGLGLKIIKEICQQYDGDIFFKDNRTSLITILSLRIPEKKQMESDKIEPKKENLSH